MTFALILVAAGSSRRAGCDKLYMSIGSKTVLQKAIEPFFEVEGLKQVIVVSRSDKLEENQKLLSAYKGKVPFAFTVGGENRTQSVRNGLAMIDQDCDLIAIHDGARPFVTPRVIMDAMKGAMLNGGAVPSLPVKDTILEGKEGVMTAPLERQNLYAVQTPQIFKAKALIEAYRQNFNTFTDDATAFWAWGGSVKLTQGDEKNYKLSTPLDVERSQSMQLRIGHGYDAHRFAQGRKLVLCGVEVPSSVGLEGVSDADAPLHALIDALFGAAGLNDIGKHFPPQDPNYQGIDSMVLLKECLNLIQKAGAYPTSADITIIAQTPRLSPYIEAMREALTLALGCPCNVKATTEEGMGFTGRKEGIAAHAVVLCEVRV